MSEYIRTNKFDTNECPNIFVKEKLIRTNVRIYIRDQYIRIFEYSNIFVTLWFKFDPKTFKPFLKSARLSELCSKYLWIYFQKTWRAGQTILKFGVFSNKIVLRKKLENKKLSGQPFSVQIFSKYFFSTWSWKIFAAVYFRICWTGPHTFSHPSANLLDFQLILVKTSTTVAIGFNSYPNIKQKWNWFQIFLSEIYVSPKNGSGGVFFLWA